MAESILRQARYLRRAVEHDIGGNHVLKNGCALAIAGATVPSSGVFEVGLRLLRRELPRQILSDGGHEERTTSYHRAVLSDLRDVTAVLRQSGESVPHWLSEPLERATLWQQLVAAPDGTLPLLNDAWEGPAIPRPATEPITELPASGYVVFRHDRDYALFDIGPISPPHLSAHAHADVLSFILWVDGRPLLVDPGSWSYTGQGRQLFRGTAQHNTVQIDEKDQCEFWGDFRAAFHPRVRATSVTRQGEVAIVAGRHDGYRRLPDSVMHERTLVWWPGSGVVVVDILRARKTHKIGSRLHVAPGVVPDQADRLAGFQISALGDGAQSVVAKGAYSAHIGVRVPTTILEDRREVRPDTPFGWSVLRGGARVESIDPQLLRLTETSGRIVEIPLSWT